MYGKYLLLVSLQRSDWLSRSNNHLSQLPDCIFNIDVGPYDDPRPSDCSAPEVYGILKSGDTRRDSTERCLKGYICVDDFGLGESSDDFDYACSFLGTQDSAIS